MNQSLIVDTTQIMAAARATGLFVSTCTIQQPDGVLDSGGAASRTWVNVTGLVDIACMNAPLSLGGLGIVGGEQKTISQILSTDFRHVLLDDYYGDVVVTGTDGNTYYGPQPNMRAVIKTYNAGVLVSTENWDILEAESDSQSTQTRLKLSQVSI